MYKYIASVAMLCILVGCNMIEYHPYDLDVSGETGINGRNVAIIEQRMKGRNEFTFAVISDTQRWYDETRDEVASINARGDIDFVVYTGDLSDFGAKLEFSLQRDILNGLTMPYVCILGNHDCVGTGEQVFEKVFGEPNFSFVAGNVRFVCLNTNALEYDYSYAVPDFSYIKDCINNCPEGVEKTVVAMHAGPFSEQFNNNVADAFQYNIKQLPSLQFCLYGHNHQVAADDLFGDGVIYYQCTCAKKRKYLVFKIRKEGYDYEVVDY